MSNKWFAESFEDAAEWGHKMGHGSDSKFYVVRVEVPDDVADVALRRQNLDNIGNARYLEVDELNRHARITQRSSIRVRCGG